MVGEYIAGFYAIENHYARDDDAHTTVGTTPGGIPIAVDSRYMKADFRIATSLIEPHLMAGFSGGRKAIVPGLASAATIGKLHGPEILAREGVGVGRLDGNPVHEELLAGSGVVQL